MDEFGGGLRRLDILEVPAMKSRVIVACGIAALVGAAVPAFAASDTGSVIKAGTPEAQRAISRLEQARYVDRMNARSYTSEDNEAGMYYQHKTQQIDSILEKLREGGAVSAEDVNRALDNSHAVRYGGAQ
jgi:hypothetical protein